MRKKRENKEKIQIRKTYLKKIKMKAFEMSFVSDGLGGLF